VNDRRQHKPGKGSLLTNLRRAKETSPHFTGEVVCDRAFAEGEIMRLAGWKKVTAIGEIITLSISRPMGAYPREERRGDDEVPF